MHGNDPNQWASLIIERGAAPLPLDDTAFRAWMARRPIFVSSVMDAELTPDREAVRQWITRWGGEPMMWETITPRDQRADRAYLEGVDRSHAFVLLLGSSYGVSDQTGFSPTHQESNRAIEAHLPRLLFTRADIPDSARDGKLNRWLRELYLEVSGAAYRTPDDLCMLLERQLREMAAMQESFWLKLGPLVFPGQIGLRRSGNGALYTVTARVRDGAVRRALSELGGFNRLRADRLTWVMETQRVTVQEVVSETGRASESAVTVACAQSDEHRNSHGFTNVTVGGGGGRSFGPADQAEVWARSTVFGLPSESEGGRRGRDALAAFTGHDGPTLPEVLRAYGAQGWLAEGLTRLFLLEHLVLKYGGHFERLSVGPATAAGVRVDARFMPGGGTAVATIGGVVPTR